MKNYTAFEAKAISLGLLNEDHIPLDDDRDYWVKIYQNAEPYSKQSMEASMKIKEIDKRNSKETIQHSKQKEYKAEFTGTCIEVGTRKGEHLPWNDASEMAYDLGYWANLDKEEKKSNYDEISKQEFMSNIDKTSIPSKWLKYVENANHYIHNGKIYIAYNLDVGKHGDIHFIFQK